MNARHGVAGAAAALAFAAGLPFAAQAQTATSPEVQFYCSFPNSPTDCGFYEQAKAKPRATIVNTAREGGTAVRLRTESGDNNVNGSGTWERNDLALSQSATDCYEGKEAWWAHSVYFPDDYVVPPSGGGGVVMDFHHTGSSGQANFHVDAMPEPTGLRLRGFGGPTLNEGRFEVTLGPVVKNQWYDFVYQIRWSSGSDGFLNAWVNGVQRLAHKGPTLYSGMGCYLKLANYHSPFGEGSSVIHDRVIRGSSKESVWPASSTTVASLEPVSTSTASTTSSPDLSGTGPFSGTPVELPAIFEAENFDRGGQGVGYHDRSAGNSGGAYRTTEDVDIIANAAGGYIVNNFQTGEWLGYTVNVPSTGNYDIAINASNNFGSSVAFHIEVDGVNVTGPISVPLTGGWSTFQWIGKQGVHLAAGTRVVKLVADAEYFDVNQIRIVASSATSTSTTQNSTTTTTTTTSSSGYAGTPYTGTPIALPGTFEAENFDQGGQNLAYRDLTAGNSGGKYRTSEDVDIITSNDSAGGGYVVNNFQTGEWLNYMVNVPTTGTYDIEIRASNGNKKGSPAFRIEVDGVDVTGPIAVASTRNWNTFQWVGKQGIALSAGTRVIRLVSVNEYFNVNQLRVLASGSSTTSPTAPANQAPTVSFKAPLQGQTVSGTLSGGACEALALDDKGVSQVQFFLGTTSLNSDTSSPYNCTLDTTKYANGTHTLRAVVSDAEGASGSAQISINIQNGTTTTPTYGGTPYTGSPIALPATFEAENFDKGGQNVAYRDLSSGNSGGQYRTSEDVDIIASSDAAGGAYVVNNFQTGEWLNYTVSVPASGKYDLAIRAANNYNSSVAFHIEVDGVNVTGPISVPVTGGWSSFQWVGKQGVDLAAGTRVLKLVADAEYFNVNQLRVLAASTTSSPPPTGSLTSAGTRAVATFESLGLYWTPGTNPGTAGCGVRFRKVGESAWKEGLAMWFDARNGECRGSLVHLMPATDYEVQFNLPGQSSTAGLVARTWSENFPIAKTVYVSSGSQTLNITEGGSASGYVLYTAAPGAQAVLDAGNAQTYNVHVQASYVIVRGLTLKGAVQDAVRISPNVTDVVIEDNDISNWGRTRGNNLGVDLDSGIRAVCANPTLERVVIQRNRIHHPRYGANSWSSGHPEGPQGITFANCGGNHVMRYNDLYSEAGRYFNDVIGGSSNFSTVGFPNSDSDIYGNRVSHAWDDAIEAEGGNKNVRIWGNYMDRTSIGVASTTTATGPLYIFRNVQNRAKFYEHTSWDGDSRNVFGKSGSHSSLGGGRRYLFHNTLLQASEAGSIYGLGAGYSLGGTGSTQPVTNTVSRNNIYQTWKSTSNTSYQIGSDNEFSHNLVNANPSSLETSLMRGTPVYQSGNGWTSEGGGMYQLAPSSLGYDGGARIPNFNDSFTGAAPDVGAHEAGTPAMRLGVNGGAAH